MTVITEIEPDFEESKTFLRESLEFERTITINGLCSVIYEGRTSTFFEMTNCMVLIKPDGSLQIHDGEGKEPVNWQPDGCEISVFEDDGVLIVRTERETKGTEEVVEMLFHEIHQITSYDIGFATNKKQSGTEEQLQERLFEDPEEVEIGLESISREYQTDAGPVDIYCRDSDDNPVFLELKRRRVGPEAVGQLKRYVQSSDKDGIRGILVSPSLTDGAKDLLLMEPNLEHVMVVPDTTLNDDRVPEREYSD